MTRNTVIATDLHAALKGRERTKGLLGRDSMRQGEALVFPRCRQVHTFGMRFEIDVLFMGKRGEVVRAVRAMRPGRLTAWVLSARTVIELPSGTLESSGTEVSDEIAIERSGESCVQGTAHDA